MRKMACIRRRLGVSAVNKRAERVRLPAQTDCPTTLNGPWILAATILGSSMAFIDGTVVNVALPALQSAMMATLADVQWVVESYGLFLAAHPYQCDNYSACDASLAPAIQDEQLLPD
jgi:hypothetical protein